MKALLALLFATTACGTTIYADHYSNDCDADLACTVISVGDICSCSCNLAAINRSDFDKYADDIQRIGGCRNTCSSSDPDASTYACGEGIGAHCSAGKCVTYAIPDGSSD